MSDIMVFFWLVGALYTLGYVGMWLGDFESFWQFCLFLWLVIFLWPVVLGISVGASK